MMHFCIFPPLTNGLVDAFLLMPFWMAVCLPTHSIIVFRMVSIPPTNRAVYGVACLPTCLPANYTYAFRYFARSTALHALLFVMPACHI